MAHPFDDVSEAALRTRRSAKWALYPADVLPAWVAEMDYPLAAPIRSALHAAIDRDDVGYADPAGLGAAFAPWAQATWGWEVAPADVHVVCDVVTGIAEILRVATAPGDGVVIEPPVYPPFAGTVRQLGRTVLPAPLVRTADGYAPDLAAIERAYASGARAHLLCSPHNPTGIVYAAEALERIAALADRHDVLVIADEIHAPLTLPGARHTPFPTVSAAAARRSIVVTSASKTWNLAGLKAAVMIATDEPARSILARLPADIPYHAGHLGILAARAAFGEGEPWRASAIEILARNRDLLGALLAAHLPQVRWVPPQAGYLAWLDCTALGLGDDPALAFRTRGRVALSPGPTFGAEGVGFARLNVATTAALLEEAVVRMARALP
ncbi:MAG: aminotransferase class I/II-fold pyridoxal phosphate-dependent enzyme [Deltaproteobacteria bacterium]|nr:aminotransferase class I/II-fold pyridoxal phosphate-dependent enzyme [Deltaproteobacteria bacterium]